MPAPIKHTCPDIDFVIKQIRSAIKLADGKYIDESNYKDCLNEIIDSLYRLDDRLEELRDANRALREWGENLEHELTFLTEENEELKNNQ